MRRLLSIFGIAIFGIALIAPSIAFEAQAEAEGPCVRVYPEARFQAVGYNHIVHLMNTCAATAECVVSTDVNPEPQTVVVPPRSETEVNTFLGSPARVFVPKVTCTMHSSDQAH